MYLISKAYIFNYEELFIVEEACWWLWIQASADTSASFGFSVVKLLQIGHFHLSDDVLSVWSGALFPAFSWCSPMDYSDFICITKCELCVFTQSEELTNYKHVYGSMWL